MPMQTRLQPMTAEERRVLQPLARRATARTGSLLAFWGALNLLLIGGVWLANRYLIEPFLHPQSWSLVVGAALMGLLHVAVDSLRAAGVDDSSGAVSRALDLQRGEVEEERFQFEDYVVLDAKECWLYALKIDDGRCLAFYADSPDPHCGAAARWSRAPADELPAQQAGLRRAPRSRVLLSLRFQGAAFDRWPQRAGEPAAGQWPIHATVWEIDWEAVQRDFGRPEEQTPWPPPPP